MSEENQIEEPTPTPPATAKKAKAKAGPGRPKGRKNRESPTYTRDVEFSISERIRQRVDPDVIIDYYLMIAQGHNAILKPGPRGVRDPHGWTAVPDHNPNATSPTLAQKMDALKKLEDRGWGLPVQSLNIDAEIRARLEGGGSGIPTQILMQYDPTKLTKLAELLLPDPNVIDAEYVDVPANKDDTTQNSAPQEPVKEP